LSALRLSPEAVEELAEAVEWYRTQRPGLEMEFLTEVRRVMAGRLEMGHGVGSQWHIDEKPQPVSSMVSSSARLAAYRRASVMSAGSR
jgi:hypothetical protein